MEFISYKDLDIYKRSYQLAVNVHEASISLPKFEMYEEGSQVRRASKSVVSNIVEGFGRRKYKQEFIKFLIYSMASCDETIEHINLLHSTGSFPDKVKHEHLIKEYTHLAKMINKFIQSVNLYHKTSNSK